MKGKSKYAMRRTFSTAMKITSALGSQSTSKSYEKIWKSEGPESVFRSQFRFYKRKDVELDISSVFDLRVSNPLFGVDCKSLEISAINPSVVERVQQCIDLRPLSEWSVSTLAHRPGLYVLNNILTRTGQLNWMQKCLLQYPEPPNVTNLSRLGDYDGKEVYKNCGIKLRWTTMGNDYDWDDKVYADTPREPLPHEITELASIVVKVLGLPDTNADAVILNYYGRKSHLSPHVDRSERDMTRPLVSVSLGQSAIYLTGGTNVNDPVDALFLHSGDVLIMNAGQRAVYHAVPRILISSRFGFDAETGIDNCVIDFANTCRVNVTIRQVD